MVGERSRVVRNRTGVAAGVWCVAADDDGRGGDVAGAAEALEGFRRAATPGDPGDAAFVAEFEQALRQVR